MGLDLGIFLEGSESTFKVKVSKNDSQAQYLLDKLTSSDGSVTITETNDGSVEQIDLTASGGGGISSPLTTKGDLFTYDTDNQRLGVGTDGQALIADSAEATGLRWGNVSGDNMATADLTLTADRTHNFNGNDLIFNTSASNRFRIWNGAGNIGNSLSFWDGGSGYMRTSFYSWTLSAGNATKDALRVHPSGETSFGYDVKIGTDLSSPAANTKLHIHSNGSTSTTTALLVENSSGTELLKVLDDGTITGNFSADNMATADLTLTTVRTHNLDGNILKFDTDETGYFEVGNVSVAEGIKIYQKSNGVNYINGTDGLLYIGAEGNDNLSIKVDGTSQFNDNLKIGSGSIGGTAARLKVRGNSLTVGECFIFEDSGGREILRGSNNRQVYTKRLIVTDTSSTNATTSFLVKNSSNAEAFKILGDLAIIMANLPTSSAGLATGQIWNNSGVLNIV